MRGPLAEGRERNRRPRKVTRVSFVGDQFVGAGAVARKGDDDNIFGVTRREHFKATGDFRNRRLIVKQQRRFTAETVRKESMERLRVLPCATQPIHARRSVTVNPNEQPSERHTDTTKCSALRTATG